MTLIRCRLPVAPAADDFSRLVVLIANQSARLFDLAGSSVSFDLGPADLAPLGDNMRTGLLAAAMELRDLLAQTTQGRQALRDLGFEPVLEHVEGE